MSSGARNAHSLKVGRDAQFVDGSPTPLLSPNTPLYNSATIYLLSGRPQKAPGRSP